MQITKIDSNYVQSDRAKIAESCYPLAEATCQTLLDYLHASQNPAFCEANNITPEQLHQDMTILVQKWANSKAYVSD